jgi:hypothetical protein
MRIAKRRSFEETEEFKDRYRWRAGIEGTMSQYDRVTGVKHLRVRGLNAVRFCAVLKALALNIFRASALPRTKNGHAPDAFQLFSDLLHILLSVKEHFLTSLRRFKNNPVFDVVYCCPNTFF